MTTSKPSAMVVLQSSQQIPALWGYLNARQFLDQFGLEEAPKVKQPACKKGLPQLIADVLAVAGFIQTALKHLPDEALRQRCLDSFSEAEVLSVIE